LAGGLSSIKVNVPPRCGVGSEVTVVVAGFDDVVIGVDALVVVGGVVVEELLHPVRRKALMSKITKAK
jgi:hypothetical protein